MIAWNEYLKNQREKTSVVDMLGVDRQKQIQKNRHYLKSVAEIILLCCAQEIALRAHDENDSSRNKGNFLEILHLVAKHDKELESRMLFGPKNASPEMQNFILKVLDDMVRKKICTQVKNVCYFSIIADETKDVSKKEQLSIIVRYFNDQTNAINKRFLTYVEAKSLDAQGLAEYILQTIDSHGLDLKCLVSQGYDGASVMSGHCSGVQQRIREKAPQAIYIHCNAHILNLALVDCSKAVSQAAEFFCTT